MATATDNDPMTYEPSDTDRKILDTLREGRNVPSNIADEIDVSRQYVQQRLATLEAAGYVTNVGRGVYELVEDPREEDDE